MEEVLCLLCNSQQTTHWLFFMLFPVVMCVHEHSSAIFHVLFTLNIILPLERGHNDKLHARHIKNDIKYTRI